MSESPAAMAATIRACWRGGLLACMALVLGGVQAVGRLARPRGTHAALPRAFHALVCRILGIRIEVTGTPVFGDATVWVGNHLSYLDVPVLGSLGPMRFVAKQEIAGWPLFGWLAGLQRTIYISRRPRDAKVAASRFAKALDEGGVVVLFPEGSSSDGGQVLPFRPSLLQALLATSARGVGLQAFSVRLRSVDGRQADDVATRDGYAYHRDMVLLPHLGAFLRLRGAVVELVFHAPVDGGGFEDRRALASELHRQVAWGLAHGTPSP